MTIAQVQSILQQLEDQDCSLDPDLMSGTATITLPTTSEEDAVGSDAEHEAPTEDDKHSCDVCGKEFESAKALGPHKRVHETDGSAMTVDRVCEVMEDNGWMTVREIVEAAVGEDTPRRMTQFHNMKTDNPHFARQLDSRSDPEDGRRNQYRLSTNSRSTDEVTANESNGFECDECGEAFDTQRGLASHHRTHDSETLKNQITPTRVQELLGDGEWRTKREIAHELIGTTEPQGIASGMRYFDKLRREDRELASSLEDRKDPADGRRKQYRLKIGEADEAEEEETVDGGVDEQEDDPKVDPTISEDAETEEIQGHPNYQYDTEPKPLKQISEASGAVVCARHGWYWNGSNGLSKARAHRSKFGCRETYMRRPAPPKDGWLDPAVEPHLDRSVLSDKDFFLDDDGEFQWAGMKENPQRTASQAAADR